MTTNATALTVALMGLALGAGCGTRSTGGTDAQTSAPSTSSSSGGLRIDVTEPATSQVGTAQPVTVTLTNTSTIATGDPTVFNMHFPAAHYASFTEPAGIAPCNKDKDRNTPRGSAAGCVLGSMAPGATLTFNIQLVQDFPGTVLQSFSVSSAVPSADLNVSVTATG